ncbi:MAG: DUF861 domain-containing protein [Bdellovibrionaceae bacterium]|nr:DUF861 domain-containing protein [Pseudobdellovibrionaceae bacterium]
MISSTELKRHPTYFMDQSEPDQTTAIAAESKDQSIQTGVWESGPGVLTLEFKWSETVYILDGYAQIKNLKTGEFFTLKKDTLALFEKGTTWSWHVPWKLKKVFTIIDY